MSKTKLGGRYQIISDLGCGGFGKTYLAEDRQLPGKPHCVVKHLKPKTTDEATLRIARRLFDTEAEVLYKLGKHDQIPQLFAHFEENEEFYLVQEYVEGQSVSEEILPGQQLGEDYTIALLQDILKILEFVHQQGVIHRDLKPSNLIRRKRDNKIVLIDFGAVKEISSETFDCHCHTTVTVTVGSPGYMPNEQFAGNPRFCSDIYAVGIIAIQALTGLYTKEIEKDRNTGEIIWRDRAQVSPGLAYILDKMVRYDFRQRYQSATSVLADLNNLSSYAAGMLGSTVVPRTSTKRRISEGNTEAEKPTKVAPSTSASTFVERKTQPQHSTKMSAKTAIDPSRKGQYGNQKNDVLPATILENNNKLNPNWFWLAGAVVLTFAGTQVYSSWQINSLLSKVSSPTQINVKIAAPTPQVSAIAPAMRSIIATPSPTPESSAISSASPTPEASTIASPSPQAVATPTVDPAKSAEAKGIVGAINKMQQLYYLENSRFASQLQDLKLNVGSRTEDYDYEIIWGDKTKALVTATAKKPGLKSYSGVVSIDGETVVDKICETNEASTAPPRIPQGFGKDFQCPYGSSGVSGLL